MGNISVIGSKDGPAVDIRELNEHVTTHVATLPIGEGQLPERLSDAELSATYVTFVDSVTGLPLVGKHVIITVDQTTDDIADITVEEI